MRRVLLPLVATLLLGGCVYYNGMYNAKRLAGQARKAERDGRTFEANNFWGQVAVKAESLVTRHPTSKWADDARVLRGTALVRLNDCTRALPPLEQVLFAGLRADLVEESAVLVGHCRAALGDAQAASAAYARLAGSRDPARRNAASLARGRALRLAGDPEAALAELDRSNAPGAPGERAVTLAALGRMVEAQELADSLLVARDSLVPWEEFIAAAGGRDLEAASALTGRVVAGAGLPPLRQGRLLLADGERWLVSDPPRALARMAEAERASTGTPGESIARIAAATARLALAGDVAAVAREGAVLEELGDRGGAESPRATQLGGAARRVAFTADSVAPGALRGDLRIFLAGENARDSLHAPRFAEAQFRRLAAEWPESPFAPKALLALVALEPADADSLRLVLGERYADSPYLAMIDAGAAPRFQELEDSLRRFAVGFRPEGRRPTVPRPGQPRPGEAASPTPRPAEDDRP